MIENSDDKLQSYGGFILTEENKEKHSKMTLMSFQEAMEYASTPQAEPRIGAEERVTDMFMEMIRENKDNKIGDGGKRSPFMISFGELPQVHKIEREIWNTYYESKEEKDRNMQLKSLLYLKEVGVYLNGLYNTLPDLAGLKFQSEPAAEEHQYGKHINGYSKDCKVCVEAKYYQEGEDSDEFKF